VRSYGCASSRGSPPGDSGEFVVGAGGGRGERWGAPPERWNPPLPSPRAAEAVDEQVPVAGAKAPTARRSVEEAVHAAEASASAAGVSASAAAVVTTGAVVTPPEPSRKRKRGFSSLS
jgi:hypothetical protein